jgi:hypothetical protein
MYDIVQQVSADQFLSLRNNTPFHDKLHEKKEFLLKTFACFTSPTQPPQPAPSSSSKHKRHRHEYKGNRSEKVKIGCRDLSRENFGRKDFMALMNKMTNANKAAILQSIKNAYRDDCQNIYTEITWSMMQKSPEFHELHWSVIDIIYQATDRKSDWQNSWQAIAEDFVKDQKWIPPESVLQSEDYDEFCEFVKWRKSTIAAIRALCMLQDHHWIIASFRKSVSDALMESIQMQINKHDAIGDKLTDALIEQLYTLFSVTNHAPMIQEGATWFKQHMEGTLARLRPATRFKLYDLQELMDRKMKS